MGTLAWKHRPESFGLGNCSLALCCSELCDPICSPRLYPHRLYVMFVLLSTRRLRHTTTVACIESSLFVATLPKHRRRVVSRRSQHRDLYGSTVAASSSLGGRSISTVEASLTSRLLLSAVAAACSLSVAEVGLAC